MSDEVQNAMARLRLLFPHPGEQREIVSEGKDATGGNPELVKVESCVVWIQSLTEHGLGISATIAGQLHDILDHGIDGDRRLAISQALERNVTVLDEGCDLALPLLKRIADLGGTDEKRLLVIAFCNAVQSPLLDPSGIQTILESMDAVVEKDEWENYLYARSLWYSIRSERCVNADQCNWRLVRLKNLHLEAPSTRTFLRQALTASLDPQLCRDSDEAIARLTRLEDLIGDADGEWWYLQATAFLNSLTPELCSDVDEAQRRLSLSIRLADAVTAARLPCAKGLVASLVPSLCAEHQIEPRLQELSRFARITPTFENVACAGFAWASVLTQRPSLAGEWYQAAIDWYRPDVTVAQRMATPGVWIKGQEEWILAERDIALTAMDEARAALQKRSRGTEVVEGESDEPNRGLPIGPVRRLQAWISRRQS